MHTPSFETGPIRPPSEAKSLLLRCTRNCPWNRCAFCHTYRKERFSLRTVEEIKADIDAMRRMADFVVEVSERMGLGGRVDRAVASRAASGMGGGECERQVAFWMMFGPETAFLQDANSLIMKPGDLAEVLRYLKDAFPSIKRITTYARSHTVARRSVEDLISLRDAGLNRIHIGMESGSDAVLKLIDKGVTHDGHVTAGRHVKEAGIELSEYVMPGLGGRALTNEHALETARALNAINPDFIRLRTLAVPPGTGLAALRDEGKFVPLGEDGVVSEIRLFIKSLDGIDSFVASDHVLNLLEGVEGRLPVDKPAMLEVIDGYLSLPDRERLIFRFGRRAGYLRDVADLGNQAVKAELWRYMETHGLVTGEALDRWTMELAERFI